MSCMYRVNKRIKINAPLQLLIFDYKEIREIIVDFVNYRQIAH